MEQKLVLNMDPTAENGRNSEGSFLRAPNGDILFAYSRYNTGMGDDHAPCDIYMIRSSDEGDTWSEPVCIAKAADFGVKNVMSVSGLPLMDGRLCFFFMIKEDQKPPYTYSSIGRAVSSDGVHFEASRCKFQVGEGYYVINNDRFIRLSDGRIATAGSLHVEAYGDGYASIDGCGEPVCFVSEDDGETFHRTPARITLSGKIAQMAGMQEPGIIQQKNGVIWMWARTRLHCQYECYSLDDMQSFTPPEPSEFTSPCSPLCMHRGPEDELYAVYNPIPEYNGRPKTSRWNGGRTPLVIRKSTDDGRTWGPLNVIEDEDDRGYCYTAIFHTNDGHLLCGYCRGSAKEGILNRLGIMKIKLDTIE